MSNMTDAEYLATGGTQCPVCRATDISGGEVNVDAGSAYQVVTCGACGASWNDVYTLAGYSELEE